MRTRLLIALFALCVLPAGAADLITRWLVITNAPIGNTNSVTLNASARTFTNSVTASPSTLIQETNTVSWSATNIANQLTTYRVSFGHIITVGTNYVAVRGAVGENLTLAINACCFGYITNSTQSVSSPTFVVRVPITVEASTNQTSIASLLTKGISDSSTNAFATNSTAISNALIKGVSPLQTVVGPLRFDGRTAVSSNFFATNGFTSTITNINPVFSNAVNYGNAIRSEGPGGNSLQVGSNAMALGTRTVAIGNGALATNNDATAIGTSAIATNRSVAVGNAAVASGLSIALGNSASAFYDQSVAIGGSATVTASLGVAVGDGAGASSLDTAVGRTASAAGSNSVAIGASASVGSAGLYSIAIGTAASATHSNSVVIGAAAASTGTNQILLGTSVDWIQSPGIFAGILHTNSTFKGTNVINGRVDFTSRANSALANNSANSGVVLGTNTYVRLSGATDFQALSGFVAEQDGSYHIVQFSGAKTNVIVNEVNSPDFVADPTAANRITTGTGANLYLTNNPVVLQFIYDATASRWRVMGYYR